MRGSAQRAPSHRSTTEPAEAPSPVRMKFVRTTTNALNDSAFIHFQRTNEATIVTQRRVQLCPTVAVAGGSALPYHSPAENVPLLTLPCERDRNRWSNQRSCASCVMSKSRLAASRWILEPFLAPPIGALGQRVPKGGTRPRELLNFVFLYRRAPRICDVVLGVYHRDTLPRLPPAGVAENARRPDDLEATERNGTPSCLTLAASRVCAHRTSSGNETPPRPLRGAWACRGRGVREIELP